MKAIRLYQDLLRFHKADGDQSAFLDTDLLRLEFGHNKAFGEEKAARYKAALKRYVERNGDHEVSARARYDLAAVLQSENDLPAAHELADEGARVFPASAGGRLCYNLARQIEARWSSINIERVWNAPWPTIRVNYRNVKAVYFRAIREDWQERMKSGRSRPEWLDQPQRKVLLARRPELAWSAALPDAGDFRERSEELAAPQQLKPGYYFLLASHDPTFTDHDNVVMIADFWVSRLALVMRSRPGDGSMEGFVLDAASGEPIAGAAVQDWGRDWNGGILTGGAGKTDSNGFFSVAAVAQRPNVIHAAFRDQQLATANDFYVYSGDTRPKPHQQTIFFTDRSLYRPGQTIQYKGIAMLVDQEADNYKVLPGRTLTVVFQDVNGKEIERREHRANDYGSFSGSFTAPRDRLMGQMVIRVEGQPAGAAVVRVEEYKRPKFQVTLEAPKAAPKLGAKVQLEGKAMAYTGAAVGGAKVRYHVVRQVRYPDWWGWWHWWQPVQTAGQEIAHGTAATGPDGAFAVEFTARPDLSVPEKDEPTFEFAVSADVTDTTGETRSAQRNIQVGYTALRATLAAGEWLTDEKPLEITVSTQTLDGEGQRAEGGLKIYRLKQPEKVQRPSLFGPRPVRVAAPPGPSDPDRNPNSWELGAVVAEEGLTTDLAGKAHVSAKLAAGAYRAKFETQDRFGKKVVAWLPLQVLGPRGQAAAHQDPQPGRRAQLVARAGRGVHGPVGHRLSARPGLHRDRASRPDHKGLLDRAGRNPAEGQAGGGRGDAGRILAPRDHGPRESGLPHRPKNRRALDQQEAEREVGALRLQARAWQKRDLDRDCHRARRQEGGGRNGGRPVRPVAGRLSAARLAAAGSASFARTGPRWAASSRTWPSPCSRCSAPGRWIRRT